MVIIKKLIDMYNELQRIIFSVIVENRCRGDDNIIDNLDLLESAEENFSIELLDFITELNEEGLGEM